MICLMITGLKTPEKSPEDLSGELSLLEALGIVLATVPETGGVKVTLRCPPGLGLWHIEQRSRQCGDHCH